MSIFSKPKVAQAATPATAPVAAVADTAAETPQGIDSFISSGSSVSAPKRKASTVKPSLIGGV